MKYRIIIAVSAVALASVATLSSIVAAEKEDTEQKIRLADVPRAVRAAIKRATKGAKVEEIEQEAKDGKTVYEVEVFRNGFEVELVFDEKGRLVGFDVEGDDEDEEDEDDEDDGDEDEDNDDDDEDNDDDDE